MSRPLFSFFSGLLASVLLIGWLPACWLLADGPADNQTGNVRPIPPPGIAVDGAQATTWLVTAARLDKELAAEKPAGIAPRDPSWTDRAAAVATLTRAVRMAIDLNGFHSPAELEFADTLLTTADDRLTHLKAQASTPQLLGLSNTAQPTPQLVYSGFQSQLDDSYQPYGLVVPAGWSPDSDRPWRLDVWLHGRGEKVLEVGFLRRQTKNAGPYASKNTFVLHPYGRYSNAFKFAGESDVLEAIAHIRRQFNIDPHQISIRGFSMGGAGCWQLAVHYPDLWFAANPGAGFAETQQFLKTFQGEDFQPTAFQRPLLHWYDCPDWVTNLKHCPTVAYSGEIDRQKQAADVMVAAMQAAKMKPVHVIGPQTAHKIHPGSKAEISRRMELLAATPRPSFPPDLHFTTYMLRYHRLHWVSIDGLKAHWQKAEIEASVGPQAITATTNNISRLTFSFTEQENAFPTTASIAITIDGQTLAGPSAQRDHAWRCTLAKAPQGWRLENDPDASVPTLRKRPGLQGPIDDAFMDRFLFVAPSGSSHHPAVETWTQNEFARAKQQWRLHFRGDVRETRDSSVSSADLKENHLVLFGDPDSNQFLRDIQDELPVRWTAASIEIGKQSFDRASHAVVMVYPNPANPDRYVVLNSGFTFREFAYLNNARQIPMLPDWAVIDIGEGANSVYPGKVVAAGFFDESWQLQETE